VKVAIVAATGVEASAARWAAPGTLVFKVGIACAKRNTFETAVISCGLAGGLRPDVPTGSVLVPRSVRRPDGSELVCDPEMTQALIRSTQDCRKRAIEAPMITSCVLIHGRARSRYAELGYAGADMETGLLQAPRIACVRVVLDTPQREIDPAWQRPASVLLHARAWRDLPFLMREGRRCAGLAARIAARAIALV